MEIELDQEGQVSIVRLVGKLNSDCAHEVSESLLSLAEQGSRVLVDMSGVDYMSSVGLRVLLMVYRKVEETAGAVMLAGVQEHVRDVMEMTGFLTFFMVVDTPEEGVVALQSY